MSHVVTRVWTLPPPALERDVIYRRLLTIAQRIPVRGKRCSEESSINDVTLERGRGVQTLVTTCDIGEGVDPCVTSHVQHLLRVWFSRLSRFRCVSGHIKPAWLCTMDDHFSFPWTWRVGAKCNVTNQSVLFAYDKLRARELALYVSMV